MVIYPMLPGHAVSSRLFANFSHQTKGITLKKRVFVFSALTLATSAALAWVDGDTQCVQYLRDHGRNHPHCPTTQLPPATPATPALTAEQRQAQEQAQRQTQAQLQAQFAQAMSQNDIRTAASVYAQMSPDMRSTVTTTVSPEQRQALENQIAIDNQSRAEANGNGSPVTITDQSRSLVYNPVQTAPLPPTLTVAGIELRKYGECGAQWKVKPYNNAFYVPRVWGLWHGREDFKTMHGELDGRADEMFRMETIDLPAPIYERVVIAWGHQLYMIATHATQGGGGSGSANHAGSSAFGVGTSLSANASHASIGVIAMPCEYRVKKADTTPPPPAPPAAVIIPPPAAALALDQDKAPFVTAERRYTGPYSPKKSDSCRVTKPDGKVIWVKKTSPEQECGSVPVTAPAVTDTRLKDGKK
jgi:hypothetical protein